MGQGEELRRRATQARFHGDHMTTPADRQRILDYAKELLRQAEEVEALDEDEDRREA